MVGLFCSLEHVFLGRGILWVRHLVRVVGLEQAARRHGASVEAALAASRLVVQESCRAWMLIVLVSARYLTSLSLPWLAVPAALCLCLLGALPPELDCPDFRLLGGLRRANNR